jgi:23S rRNA (guanosine2251-2'-O)-methyltransferase
MRRPSKPIFERPSKFPPRIFSVDAGISHDKANPMDYKKDETAVQLFGRHTVIEACKNPHRTFRRLFASENALARLKEEGVNPPSDIIIVHPRVLDHLLGADAVHQGLYLECDPLDNPPLEKLRTDGVVVLLDQITDPHNVGAILRTCVAFDVKAIITTNRHSPEATGVLAKSASGALEHVPLISVRNLNVAMETLKSRGFTIVGLDSEGSHDLMELPMKLPLALVLGAEGKGLRALTRDTCDKVARLDLPGKIKSLNVSNAAAIALMAVRLKTQ